VKICVLSDVHGNLPALEAVVEDIEQWRPDHVIVNGDLVSRGPYSLRCLRLIRERLPHSRLLAGNHEELVVQCAGQAPRPEDPTFDLRRFAHWTAEQLGAAVADIQGLEDHLDLSDSAGGSAVHVTHGSMLGNRDGIHVETAEAALPAKLGDPRDLFIASHTHKPMVRRFDETLVVNVGSVGQPFDGDPRAAYGRFSFRDGAWRAEIARVSYDKTQAERDLADSGFMDEGGPLARIIQHELRHSQMHAGRWMSRFLHGIKAGEISVAEAVDEYLAAR